MSGKRLKLENHAFPAYVGGKKHARVSMREAIPDAI